MPGLFGHTIHNRADSSVKTTMPFQLNVVVKDGIHAKTDYATDDFLMKHVCFDFQKNYPFFFKKENLNIWIYGDPVIDSYTGADAYERLAKTLQERHLKFSGLEAVDGLYTAVVHDSALKKLFLVGDRDGLCHLYYSAQNGQLYWGSELRAFLNNNNLNLTLRKESLFAFLELGYLIKDSTWFNEVHLLPPSSFLEWDLREKHFCIHEYWNPENISDARTGASRKQLIGDLKDLMSNAVKKRVGSKENVGITLSGGFDSRTIFANIPNRQKDFTAVTRGMKGCSDVALAKDVVKNRKDVNHIIYELNEKNWLSGRVEAINVTSGQKDIVNMNALASLPVHKQNFDINLDGAGAAAAFKKQDLAYSPTTAFKNKLSKKHLVEYFSFREDVLNELLSCYQEIDSSSLFYIRQRGRRFSVFGSILGHDYGIISRFPFLDFELQRFMHSLPQHVNRTTLFFQFLIAEFPEYFVKIKNQKTGTRLYANQNLVFFLRATRYLARKAGLEKHHIQYHDYKNWLRYHDNGLLEKYARMKDAPLYEYVDQNEIQTAVSMFMQKGSGHHLISRIISLNYFLSNVDL